MTKLHFPSLLENNSAFETRWGIFYQKGLNIPASFEQIYTTLRKKEGRLYKDEVITYLPQIPKDHPHEYEWQARKLSARRLLNWILKNNSKYILDVGCGNGWLLNYLSLNADIECCGVDVNETELKQGARVFGRNPKLTFVYCDIFSNGLNRNFADTIILASAIQYFSDIHGLLNTLFGILKPGGVVHIVDSPFYSASAMGKAKKRSEKHFRDFDSPGMVDHYYHHTASALSGFDYWFNYNPSSIRNRICRQIIKDSPFPWIIVRP